MFAYDVWVNWVDGMTKAHGIPEFHEWRRDDTVSLMDHIPVVHGTAELFDAIESGFDPIPKELLDEVYRKGVKRQDHEAKRLDYAFIITDGNRIVAVDTDGEDVPNFKSRLVPRQEEVVFEMVSRSIQKDYGYVQPEKSEIDKTLMGRILSLEPVHMYGLTRRERQMKEMLMGSLFQLCCSKNIEEVTYWFTDLFWGMKDDLVVETMTIEQMVADMHDYLVEGWDEQHEAFGKKLAIYFDNYEGMWEELEKKVEGIA